MAIDEYAWVYRVKDLKAILEQLPDDILFGIIFLTIGLGA